MNITKTLLFVSLLLLPQGCYTVLKQNPGVNQVHIIQPTLPPNTEDTSELSGVWIHKRLWMDYGYEYNRLEIYTNGKLVYIPSSERSNSEVFLGGYYVSSDTMSILFKNIGLEMMKYNLNADTLLLKSINSYGGTRESIINDCYSCTIRRIRNH
jgi:hypothetical protein